MGGGGKPSVDDLDLREGPKIWAPGGADSGDDKDFKPVKFDSNSLKKNKNNQVNTQLEFKANCNRTIKKLAWVYFHFKSLLYTTHYIKYGCIMFSVNQASVNCKWSPGQSSKSSFPSSSNA